MPPFSLMPWGNESFVNKGIDVTKYAHMELVWHLCTGVLLKEKKQAYRLAFY